MLRTFKDALLMLVVLTVVTGVVYPLVVTGIAQAVFPAQANGSLIERDGKAVGSALIGQPFSDPKYFWSRASATSPDALQRRRVVRVQPGSAQPGARRRGQGRASRRCGPPIRTTRRRCPSIS